jgi:hypothetical protein
MFDRNGGIFGNFQMYFGFGMVMFLIVKFPRNITCLVQVNGKSMLGRSRNSNNLPLLRYLFQKIIFITKLYGYTYYIELFPRHFISQFG